MCFVCRTWILVLLAYRGLQQAELLILELYQKNVFGINVGAFYVLGDLGAMKIPLALPHV